MNQASESNGPVTGSPDMRLPDELRAGVIEHLDHLRDRFMTRGWGGRVGFGQRPAVVVIDLALFWTQPQHPMGSRLDSVVDATCRILKAARTAHIPIFFTTATMTQPIRPARNHGN